MPDNEDIYIDIPLLEVLTDENMWKSIKPISPVPQVFTVNYEYPVEFNFSPIPPEIAVGSIGVIVFPDNTTQQIIVSSIEGSLVKATSLDPKEWIENPVFKLDNLEEDAYADL